MGFKRSLDIGNKGQQIVTKILEDAGLAVTPSVGKVMEWDLRVQGQGLDVYCEVKFDKYASKSGNVAIETYNSKSNTLSGIYGTTASLWFHVFDKPEEVWVSSVNKLREYCQNKAPDKMVFSGGDGNADLLLFKKTKIIDIFTILNGLEKEKIAFILGEILKGG